MHRTGQVHKTLVHYNCPTCRMIHSHGYDPEEKQPYRRVTHCPMETQDVLITICN